MPGWEDFVRMISRGIDKKIAARHGSRAALRFRGRGPEELGGGRLGGGGFDLFSADDAGGDVAHDWAGWA
jgi:hypothetical protein